MKSITQDELNEKLELHELWLLEMEGGKQLNLSNMNLSSLILNGLNLSYADLTDANLCHADLIDVNLTGANLTGANLTDVDLTSANLTIADLTGANLTNTKLQWVTHQDIEGKSVIAIQFNASRKNNQLSYWKDLGIWTTGCFQGSLEELLERINDTHKGNVELRNKYLLAMDTILKLSKEE